MEIGRICVKIAGRDAGQRCVVVEVIDTNYVLIDGETRRRKCNIRHLEPLTQLIEIKKGADHDAVKKALKSLGIEMQDTKPKKKTEKPTKKRNVKEKPAKTETKEPKKAEVKKEAPKKESHAKPSKK
ncbi:MAG: 50S ribosomal protein L14e [Nanoarchaeota archaeon]